MFNHLIKAALNHRLLVLAIAAFVTVYSALAIRKLPVDIFPDLNRPVVTIMAECHGMAPEDVETLVTIPIETAMGGLVGVERVRSSSAIGLSLIYVEFGWGTDIYLNRQLVSEKLALVQKSLPEEVHALIGPITSLMGEVQLVGISSPDETFSLIEMRQLADWVVKKRLLAIPGVAQVTVLGGLVKQYQVLISSEKLKYYGLTLEELEHSLSHLSQNTSGGFYNEGDQALLVRNIGAVECREDIEESMVGFHIGKPVLVKDIAEVKEDGPSVRYGDGSINGSPGVLLTVRKQPETSTILLTEEIQKVLVNLENSLPKGIVIEKDLFKQANFIETSIHNIKEVLRDGAIIVGIVLFLFLLNFRTTFISLTAIPLSFLITLAFFHLFGLGVNTMTLGGLAIAIGELVDDAIVDVENVFRRLRENRKSGAKKSPLRVIYEASLEVRSSIVFATIIVISVFIPLFYLDGLEGRFFIPLGIAYIVSLLASLIVSLTVTPVLCSYLLPQAKVMDHEEGRLVKFLKWVDEKGLEFSLDHPGKIIASVFALSIMALATIPFLGTTFLPEFQEGTATVFLVSPPSTSLEAANKIGKEAEGIILSVEEVKNVARRTGRAREDEHVHGVNVSEIDVDFHEGGRHKTEVLADIRKKLESVEGAFVSIGQPIAHRIDHMMSGVTAQIAIKLFGPELSTLRRKAYEIFEAIKDVDGVVDLQVEQQTLVPQTKIHVLRDLAAEYGVIVGDLTTGLELALQGETVAQVLEHQRTTDVVARFDEQSRSSVEQIKKIPVRLMPDGTTVHLEGVADVYTSKGPNAIHRENQRRRIVIQANTAKRDLGSIVQDIQKRISEKVPLPPSYFIAYDGQFKTQQEATRQILLLSILSLLAIFILLWTHFKSAWLSIQVMLSVPFAMIGALFALIITEPVLSIASLIGLITLCGIASRNTIMMLSHYIHLVKEEGEQLTKEMVIRGSLERLLPVLMTSLTAILALLPLAMAAGEAGKEILHPLSVVIIGGLISSTLLDIIVTPTIFYNYGRKATEKALTFTQEVL